jgi:Na+/pantothenate symporter
VGQPDAALVVIFFFVGAILAYIGHGARRDTVNQFEHADGRTAVAMVALIVGEIGGFGVILAGFIVGQLL